MNFIGNKEHDLVPEQIVRMFVDVWQSEHGPHVQDRDLTKFSSNNEGSEDDKAKTKRTETERSPEITPVLQSSLVPFVKSYNYSSNDPVEDRRFGEFIKNSGNVSMTIGLVWALWECARFCINSRLKTPFGGAVQTFENIERLAVQVASLNDVALKDVQAAIFNKN
jgi:hypothetical protein